MSLSKNQKKRLYGENTQATPEPTTAPPRSARRPDNQPITRGDVAPEPEARSSFMFAGVAFFITLLLTFYYFAWVLPEMSERAGTTIPELMFWFDAEHLRAVAQGLGREDLVQYQYIHRSSGLVYPLLFAGSWVAMIAGAQLERTLSRAMMALPVFFATMFIAGGFVLDSALANPDGGASMLAATLIAVRWVLFVTCWVQLIWLAIRLVRSKLDAFARGKLN